MGHIRPTVMGHHTRSLHLLWRLFGVQPYDVCPAICLYRDPLYSASGRWRNRQRRKLRFFIGLLKVVNDCTYLLKSHTVLDEVISSLNLDMEYEDLYDCVSTSNPEDTRILEVTVKADSPELAKRIVDRICTIGSKRIEDAMGFQQVNLYELGTTDPDPCNSTRMLTFAFAGVVAAVVTYVIFLIIFLLDDRIKTDDENLERYLGLSVLGNIPNADGRKSGKYGYYKTYAAYRTSAKQEVEDK